MAKTVRSLTDIDPAKLVTSTFLPEPVKAGGDNKVRSGTLSALPTDPQSTAACSLTFNRVDVSGCYSVSGVSKATVSVEVAWSGAAANDYIVVTTAGQSRTIVPGITTVTYPQPTSVVIQGTQTIVTPQFVAFDVTLTGAAGSSTVTAQFVGSAGCQNNQSYKLPARQLAVVAWVVLYIGISMRMVFNRLPKHRAFRV